MTDATLANVGTLDRILRIVAGVLLLLMAAYCPWASSFGPVMTWGAGTIGAILVITAVFRFCPIYRMLGICSEH